MGAQVRTRFSIYARNFCIYVKRNTSTTTTSINFAIMKQQIMEQNRNNVEETKTTGETKPVSTPVSILKQTSKFALPAAPPSRDCDLKVAAEKRAISFDLREDRVKVLQAFTSAYHSDKLSDDQYEQWQSFSDEANIFT